MPPIDFLYPALVSDAIRKRQRSLPSVRACRHGRDAFLSIHTEGSIILWSWISRTMASKVDRRGESDNHTEKKERGCATMENVSADFAFRSHRLSKSSH